MSPGESTEPDFTIEFVAAKAVGGGWVLRREYDKDGDEVGRQALQPDGHWGRWHDTDWWPEMEPLTFPSLMPTGAPGTPWGTPGTPWSSPPMTTGALPVGYTGVSYTSGTTTPHVSSGRSGSAAT